MPRSPTPRFLAALVLAGVLALPIATPAAAQPPEEVVEGPPAAEGSRPGSEAAPAPPVEERVETLLPEGGDGDGAAGGAVPDRRRSPRVAAVEVRSDAPLTREARAELDALLTFAPGDLLTEERVSRALRNLRASGIASRVDLLVRPAGTEEERAAGEVVAVVVLRANLLVEEVRVEGDLGAVDRHDLDDALFQEVGEPLIEGRVVRGVYALQEHFEGEGYFEARVRVVPEIDEVGRRATVIYRIEAGPRAQVLALGFDGDVGPFAPDRLEEPLRLKVGSPFRRAAAERDAERLEGWLIDRGHRAAQVDLPRVDYDAQRQGVVVVYPLEVGPEVHIRVEGAEAKKLRKQGLLPFDEGYDEALLLLAETRIRDRYQAQGHYRVEVDAREQPEDGVLNVVVEIEPGPVYRLTEVRFEGNREYSDDRLRELVATQPSGLLSNLPVVGGDAGLVSSTLSADLDNLRAFYALEGYVDAKVGPADVEVLEEPREIRVTIPIEAGLQQRVTGLSIDGVEALDRDQLREAVPLRQGGPFHPRILDLSLNEIRSRYEAEGYSAVNVSANTTWNPDHTRVDVAIRVLEGPQTVVDRLIVRGNRRTHTEVIRRAVDLERGEPVSRGRLLEAERQLYRLGIFSRASLELTPAPLGAESRDVVVRVEEGRVRSLRYGVGVEYDSDLDEVSYGGSVGVSHANLFGRGISASADARVLSREEQYRLFVEQPTLGDLAIPVNYSLFRNEERRSSFRVLRRGGRVEARRQLTPRTRFGLAYDYRIVDNAPLDFVPPGADDDLQRTDQTLRVSSLIPSLFMDYRDDPVNPREGWSSLVQLQWAFPVLSAEADYLKLFLQHSQYLPLGFATLAVSARVGGIEPLAPLPADIRDPFIPPGLGLPSEDIFLAERFFAGGDASHRAYGRDELGIPFATCLGSGGEEVAEDCAATLFPDATGDLKAAGGNGLALLNVDLRFPLFGPVEGVVFYDAGNLWADWRQIDLGDFRSGAGVEVRYTSPVGPLRVGIGVPLDPYDGADDYNLYLSLGTPF